MKKLIWVLVVLMGGLMANLMVGIAQPAVALTDWDEICNDSMASYEAKQQAGCYEGRTVLEVSEKIFSAVISIVVVVAVGAIIMGSYYYTSSAGDAARIKKARDTIIYGVIGLVIAMLAFAIVRFVLEKVF